MSSEENLTPWQRFRSFLAGYCSGVGLVLVGHPFDTIKVRLQTEGTHGRFKGPIDCLKQTYINEGFRGIYKGMSAPLVATGGINAIMFGIQFNVAHQFVKIREGYDLSVSQVKALTSTGDHMKAAIFSGFFISFIVTPIEGVKGRLQVQYRTGEGAYKGPIDCAVRVYKELGLTKGIFRGWLPTCLCRMSNYSYFGGYAFISTSIRKTFDIPKSEKLPIPASLFAGGMAGFLFWLSCYPFDVIKIKLQTDQSYKGMRDVARSIWKKDGYKGFLAGFTPCALRAFPANGAAFVCFEMAMRLLPE